MAYSLKGVRFPLQVIRLGAGVSEFQVNHPDGENKLLTVFNFSCLVKVFTGIYCKDPKWNVLILCTDIIICSIYMFGMLI